MGLSDYLKKKVHEKYESYKQERSFRQGVNEQRKAEERLGYQKGMVERGKREGYAKGIGEYATTKEHKQYGMKNRTQGVTGHGVAGRVAGANRYAKRADGIMGWSGSMWGDEPRSAPQRVTTVNPRTGVVKISEPIGKPRHDDSIGGLGDFGGLGVGLGESFERRGKKEKHFLDPF